VKKREERALTVYRYKMLDIILDKMERKRERKTERNAATRSSKIINTTTFRICEIITLNSTFSVLLGYC